MPNSVVVNTGPLIALARAEALDLIGRLPFRFVAPQEVRNELAEGMAVGLAPIDPAWMTWLSLDNPLNPVARAMLDTGEAAVIQLRSRRASVLCASMN
jgi:predicted nucleic acid-binding protein